LTDETIKVVVGFDFGHGETAAALMNLEGLAHPEMPEIAGKRN
jgi:molecular chaperone DnaK (HSP70)